MNSSAFEKVLLSAILTSCTVFSVSMVAFTPRRPEPITIEPTDRIEASEDINHRDSVIRHIGMSIVLSVGAGITTAEMIRKWGRSRDDAERRQGFSAQAMLQAVTMPDLALPADGFTASFSDIRGNGIDEWTDAHKHAATVLESDRTGTAEPSALPLFLFQRATPQPLETVNWFLPTPDDGALSGNTFLEASPIKERTLEDWQPSAPLLLATREQYQTCRVFLADAPERLLAILFEGDYYRFVKIAPDREQALSIAARLDQRGESTVITSTDDRYAVWVLAPDAYPETIATDLVISNQRF